MKYYNIDHLDCDMMITGGPIEYHSSVENNNFILYKWYTYTLLSVQAVSMFDNYGMRKKKIYAFTKNLHSHFTCNHDPYIWYTPIYLDGLVQDCNNSIANALELLQSCAKLSAYGLRYVALVRIFQFSILSISFKVSPQAMWR